MNQDLKRHDFIWLTQSARERIAADISQSQSPSAMRMACAFLASDIPGVVRRSSPCDIGIGVGISFPMRSDGNRLRYAASVSPAEINSVTSPYEVIDLPFVAKFKPLLALEAIKQMESYSFVRFGVYGATSLQLLTGLNYLHDGSDLDLVIDGGSPDSLMEINNELYRLSMLVGVNIDAEVIVDGDYGVKLKELVGGQKCVLAKTLHSVELKKRRDVIQSLEFASLAVL